MVSGAILISLGLASVGGILGHGLAALGLAAILEAQFDVCLTGRLAGCPVDGRDIRTMAQYAALRY
jgi:hypothetical protein